MSYTRAQLRSKVNGNIKNKGGILVDFNETLNTAARSVLDEVDLRSTKRKTTLSPNLFNEVYQYAAPADLKGLKVISVAPQVNRERNAEVAFVLPDEFHRRLDRRAVAVDDRDAVRKILANFQANPSDSAVVDSMDSATGWSATGDAENVAAETTDYVAGSGALGFGIGAGATSSAGVEKSTLATLDITDFLSGSAFVWAYLQSADGVTGFTLRIGGDASNYYAKSVTAPHDHTAFQNGWNLVRFDLSSATTTGAPVASSCSYARVSMDKSTAKVSETGYRFDHLVLRRGAVYPVVYYSKFPWRSAAGAWLENATADTDVLNADTDEVNLFIAKATELAAGEVTEDEIEKKWNRRFVGLAASYLTDNPSEALLLTSTYYDF